MNRNLDDNYYTALRSGEPKRLCFSDLEDHEKVDFLRPMDRYGLRTLIRNLRSKLDTLVSAYADYSLDPIPDLNSLSTPDLRRLAIITGRALKRFGDLHDLKR